MKIHNDTDSGHVVLENMKAISALMPIVSCKVTPSSTRSNSPSLNKLPASSKYKPGQMPNSFYERNFQMLPHQAINLSLSTLIFAYNNHYGTFHSTDVQRIYKSCETIDTSIRCSDDFSLLTHNCLLSAFQSHCIVLHEAAMRYCDMTKRPAQKEDDPTLYAVRKFILELRNAHAHMAVRFLRFSWDRGNGNKKKPFRFTIYIPVSGRPDVPCYNPASKSTRKLTIQGTPGRELRTTKDFIGKIILLSYHFKKIFAFRTTSTCDAYANRYKSIWLSPL